MAFPQSAKRTFKYIRKSHVVIAVLLTVALLVWLASGDTFRAATEAPEQTSNPAKDTSRSVEARVVHAQEYTPRQIAQGELLPLREVEIRSQTSAQVSDRTVELGERVSRGQLLFQLNRENRTAQLERAEAELDLRAAELRAGERLFNNELLSETEYLRLKAALASARADREQAALQLGYTQIEAPFDGIVDRLPAEEGDYVQVGQGVATLVDISALELSAYVPQQRVQSLMPGLPVEATLLDGTTLAGALTYVASRAESSTRSFRVEALILNPDLRHIAGSSATLTIQLPQQQAHRLSPAFLVLGDDGQLGIKAVGAEQRVVFLPLTILGFDTAGVWVDGLPNEVELITLGGGFVEEGDQVDPVRVEQP